MKLKLQGIIKRDGFELNQKDENADDSKKNQ